MLVLLVLVLELVVVVMSLSRRPRCPSIVPPVALALLLCLLMMGAAGMTSGVSARFPAVSASRAGWD